MSYSTVKAGALSTITAHTTGLRTVSGAEPRSVEGPALYLLGKSFTRETNGQRTTMAYTFTARLAVLWTEPAAAEAALDPYVNSVPAAIDTDPFLAGALTDGIAECASGVWGWWEFGTGDRKITYRILDFVIMASETADFRSGI